MEFSFYGENSELILPVTPDSFNVSKGSLNSTVDVLDVGEINLISNTNSGKLKSISFSSFFPKRKGSYCENNYFPDPYECVNRFEEWMNDGSKLEFTISETNVSRMIVTVENFEYGEKDGTGDVYYSLELKEYRTLALEAAITNTTVESSSVRPVEIPTQYEVKANDNLTKIAAKYGTTVDSLVAKNNIKNRDLIYIGQVLNI
jgi:LysM repeat protein